MPSRSDDRYILQLDTLTKRFGDDVAVDGVSLDIERGEFVTLLGPSGCGKSTILRMIAGFLDPSEGEIRMNGRRMNGVMPYDRGVGLVFQNLALFPHLSVAENIAFGLRVRRMAGPEIARKVDAALDLVGLAGFGHRRIGQISGGQRQRVALARSLVTEPAVLLLDEPLSALDLKLRRQLQIELKSIQQKTGTTFIFVTHDQEEALSMSDRIAVMNAGQVEQFGTAVETYHRPRTPFVARFVGETNLLSGRVRLIEGGEVQVELDRFAIMATVPVEQGMSLASGDAVHLSIRPELMKVGPDAGAEPVRVDGRVQSHSFSGAAVTYTVATDSGPLIAQAPFVGGGIHPFRDGTGMTVGWNPASMTLIPETAAPRDRRAAIERDPEIQTRRS